MALLKKGDAVARKKEYYDDIEQSIDVQAFVESVKEGFGEVLDPREPDNQSYSLMNLLVMILCAVIAGANSITGIHQYARLKIGMFSKLLGISKAPCYMVFWWLLTRLEPEPLQVAFINWASKVSKEIKSKLIAIDGKYLNGLVGGEGIHLVAAWESSCGLLLGQVKAEEKSNEITAIPELLDMIDVNGANVTIDAAGCQKEIAKKIRENGGDYTLALKGNQGTLHADAENFFLQAQAVGFTKDTDCMIATTLDKGHGRIEERKVVVTNNLNWLNTRTDWADIKSMIQVTSTRIFQGKETEEKRYYISSKKWSPEEAGLAIRNHWSIENHLHWCMDVIFCEDASLANTGHAGENLAMFRRMAHALIKQDVGGTVGIAKRRREAAWDDTYALRILGRLFRLDGKSF
jgi:predicted transposase YbfD/YdcC